MQRSFSSTWQLVGGIRRSPPRKRRDRDRTAHYLLSQSTFGGTARSLNSAGSRIRQGDHFIPTGGHRGPNSPGRGNPVATAPAGDGKPARNRDPPAKARHGPSGHVA